MKLQPQGSYQDRFFYAGLYCIPVPILEVIRKNVRTLLLKEIMTKSLNHCYLSPIQALFCVAMGIVKLLVYVSLS